MPVSILDLSKSYLNDNAVEKMAGHLGENPFNVKSALNGILPTLLWQVIQNASAVGGVEQMMELIRKQADSSLLFNLKLFLENKDKMQIFFAEGAKLLPSLLGNKQGSLVDSFAASNDLKKDSVSSIFAVAAPVLLSVLNKQVTTTGMGISGLAGMLTAQKTSVAALLPEGIASFLNFSNAVDFKGVKSRDYSGLDPNQHNKGISKLLVLLAAGSILIGTIFVVKNCQKNRVEIMDETAQLPDSSGGQEPVLAEAINATKKTGIEKLGTFFKKKLPTGIELSIPEHGIENNMISFIEDRSKLVDKTTWFNFDRINFATGSRKLSAESLEQIRNLASILKAYPKVNLKIGGYTDDTGDSASNLKLSKGRADAVKLAIENEGIENGRLQAEGYGQEFPAASNEAEHGRNQNRRIAVRVTKK